MDAKAGLTVVQGSVGEQPEVVASAMAGHDAVLSGLGNHTWLRGGRTITVMAAATANLITAMEVQNVKRIVIPVAWGAGASRSATSMPDSVDHPRSDATRLHRS